MFKLVIRLLVLSILIIGLVHSLKTPSTVMEMGSPTLKPPRTGIYLDSGWQKAPVDMPRGYEICTTLRLPSNSGFPFVDFYTNGDCYGDETNNQARVYNIMFRIACFLGISYLLWKIASRFTQYKKH